MGINRSLAHKTVLTSISSFYRSTRALTQAEPHLAVTPEQLHRILGAKLAPVLRQRAGTICNAGFDLDRHYAL